MSARDVGFAIVMVFALGIAFFTLNYVMDSSVDILTANPVISASNTSRTAFESISTKVTARLDYVVFGLFIGFLLALIITSWFIGGHPIFMFIYFIVVVVMVIASAILSNFWETYSTASIFGATAAAFPITNHLLSYLPIYATIMGFIGIVVMFAKPTLRGVD